MENVVRIQISPLTASTRPAISERKPESTFITKVLATLRSLFAQSDLDYATFECLESKRTPQEMRRNGLY